jgi:hypothetical protein
MALESREIQVLLSFVTDPQSRAAIQQAFDSLGAGFKTAQDAATALDAEYSKVFAKIGTVSDPQKRAALTESISNIRMVGRASLDAAEASGTLNGEFIVQRESLRRTAAELSNVDKAVRTTTVSFRNFGGAMRWAILGMSMQRLGRFMEQPWQKAFGLAGSFAKGAEKNDAAAQRWLNAMERIEKAEMRVGRVLSEQIGPYLEMLAGVVESIADFAEKHPELVKASVLSMGGVAILGTVLSAGSVFAMLASALRIYGAVGGVAAAGGAAGGGAAAGGVAIGSIVASAGAVILALAAGGIIGKLIYEHFKQPGQGGMLAEAGKSLLMLSEIGGLQFARLTDALGITEGRAIEVAQGIAEFNQSLEDLGRTSKDAGQALQIPKEAIQTYADYLKAESEATLQHNAERNEIEEKAAQERVSIEQNAEAERNQIIADGAAQRRRELEEFNLSQARQARDWANSETQWEEDYYAQRMETVKSDRQEIIQAEQDFQKRMRELRQKHEDRLDDLVASRDALGIVREMRSYERERQQAIEEHQVEMQRMKADNADKLCEMDTQFAKEKARRLENYEQTLADQQEDFDRQMAQEKAAEQKRLAAIEEEKRAELLKLEQKNKEALRDLDNQYRKEKQARYDAMIEQLNDLEVFTGKMKASWDEYYSAAEAGLKALIEKAKNMGLSEGETAGKQAGGYASYGRYLLGERGREFVLSAGTTRQAERFVGGGLTQGRLIGALAGGGGVVIENLVLPGTNMNEQQIARFMQDKFPGFLADALQKARGRLNI